ncbi:MAG: hypothetical protein AAF665_00550 [Pseudomonadota bacterium]
MTGFPDPPANEKVLDVLQIVALNAAISTGLLVVLKAAGAAWGVALLTSWIGGGLVTLCFAMCVYLVHERNVVGRKSIHRSRDLKSSDPNASHVPSDLRDPVAAWEIDRLMEIDQMLAQHAHRHSAAPYYTKADMVRLWDNEAREDTAPHDEKDRRRRAC